MTTIFSVVLFSCQKEIDKKTPQQEESVSTAASNNGHGHLAQTKTFSSEVVQKWLDMKYRVLRQPQEPNSTFGFLPVRLYSAMGIALYESVVPGMPAYQSLSGQLLEMPSMPKTTPGFAYHWAVSANAALAYIFRKSLPNTSAANKAAIDSLENALDLVYITEVNTQTFQRSKNFGILVADRVFNWLNTDGAFYMYPPYVPPVGPGLWVPTPPAFIPVFAPYVGQLRPLMPGVLNENFAPPPLPYSTASSSAFFNIMNDVYDTRQLLLNNGALKAQANYWRGLQGGSGYILWYAILRKILSEQGNEAMLDKAALAYCKLGIVHKDATIGYASAAFYYNQLAPITYIRNVMGFTTWNSEFPTPPLPCYPEIHSMQYSSSADVLSREFGSNYHLNTDGIHPLGLPGYTFTSFAEAAVHGNQSRFLAGVATQNAVNAGAWVGNKTAEYLADHIRFLKEL